MAFTLASKSRIFCNSPPINLTVIQDELEEDVQKEVDKILSELTLDVGSKIAKAPAAPEASLQLPEPELDVEEEEGEVKDELEQMENRLQALRS